MFVRLDETNLKGIKDGILLATDCVFDLTNLKSRNNELQNSFSRVCNDERYNSTKNNWI